MLRYFSPLSNKEAAPASKSHSKFSSYVLWENIGVYFVIIYRCGACYDGPKKLRGGHSCCSPQCSRFNANSKHFDHHAGVDLIMWGAGPALELTFDWSGAHLARSYWTISHQSVKPRTMKFTINAPNSYLIHCYSPLNSCWNTTFKYFNSENWHSQLFIVTFENFYVS